MKGENFMSTESILLLLKRDLQAFSKELELFPDEEAIWKTLPGVSNSAGNLALHVCGNLQHFVGATLGATGYVRNRPAEFETRGLAREVVLAEIQKTIAVVETVLPGVSEDVLSAPYPDILGGPRPATGLFLLHLCTHLALHLGQAGYLRRILTGDNAATNAISLAALANPA